MATRNSRRRSKNVIDLESSGDELELTGSSEDAALLCVCGAERQSCALSGLYSQTTY